MKPPFSFYCLVVVALFVQAPVLQAGGNPVPGNPPIDPGASAPVWQELQFSAGNIAGSVSTSIMLVDLPATALNDAPYTTLENVELQIIPDALSMLEIQGEAKTLVGGGSETRGKIWFDPRTGSVLQRDRLKPGKKGVRKIYRFARDGAMRIRQEPADRQEARGSPDNWSKVKETFYPYDLAAAKCLFVSDPALLVYLVSAPGYPLAGTARDYCMFFDGALYRTRVIPAGNVSDEVRYTVVSNGEETKTEGTRQLATLVLEVTPLTPGADPSDFELLEVRGDITLFVDETTGLPVRIRGQRRGIGELNIRLQRAVVSGSD